MNCPQCGAAVKDGKFCNYCGAKLPDDVKRTEIRIEKQIEDVAEIRRADYETAESRLRQQKMAAELRGKKVRRISCLAIIVLAVLLMGQMMIFKTSPLGNILPVFIVIGAIFMLFYVIYLLITGKW